MRTLLLILIFFAVPATAGAQQAAVPPLVARGFEAYAARGAEAAVGVWTEGWAEEDVAEFRATLLSVLPRMEEEQGRLVGYEILGMTQWGAGAGRVYVLFRYEKRPLYGRFHVYRGTGDWRILNLAMNTDPDQIFPPALLAPPGLPAGRP